MYRQEPSREVLGTYCELAVDLPTLKRNYLPPVAATTGIGSGGAARPEGHRSVAFVLVSFPLLSTRIGLAARQRARRVVGLRGSTGAGGCRYAIASADTIGLSRAVGDAVRRDRARGDAWGSASLGEPEQQQLGRCVCRSG